MSATAARKSRQLQINREGRLRKKAQLSGTDDEKFAAAEAQELAGIPLEVVTVSKLAKSGIQIPVAPFQRWVVMQLRRMAEVGVKNPKTALAAKLHVAPATVQRWLDWGDDATIDEAVVDRVTSAEGSVMGWQLYLPELPLTVLWHLARSLSAAATVLVIHAEQLRQTPTRVVPACATPGCHESRNGGRFCHEHTLELARIRAELSSEAKVMSDAGGAPRSKTTRARAAMAGTPRCCNPDCDNPRDGEHAQRFCGECVTAGWTEGIYV